MPIASLNRRAVLQTGAVAAGALAFDGLRQRAEAAAKQGAAPWPGDALTSGMLSGWVIVELDHAAIIRFAHLDPGAPPRELGEPAQISLRRWSGLSCHDQMRRATSAAHDLARRRLAQAWNVARKDCVLDSRMIRDRRSDRVIGYSVWVDLA